MTTIFSLPPPAGFTQPREAWLQPASLWDHPDYQAREGDSRGLDEKALASDSYFRFKQRMLC